MHKLDIFDRETARLYELLKSIHTDKHREDRVWDNFCKEMNKEKEPKRYFKKHPKHISNSSSEILSPRSNTDHAIKRGAKSANCIKLVVPNDKTPNISDSSIEIVTIRDELPLKSVKNTRLKSTPAISDRKTSILRDKKKIKNKDAVSKVSISEKLPHSTVLKSNSSKQIRHTGSETSRNVERIEEHHRNLFEKKLHGIIDKSLHCMEDIRVQLDAGISTPDGVEDLERRKRRSAEFASRFSRNYLYQLNRLIIDMGKIQKPSSGRISFQNNFSMRQKLTSSYQTILQGLQAFLSHLPVSMPLAVPDKVKELLREITSLCDIHRQYENIDCNSNVKTNSEVLDILEVRSRCLIDKIDEYYSTPSAINLLQSNSKYSLLDQNKSKRRIKSRFSMYSGPPNRKDVYWKKAISSLAKKKFNVRSKYKTAHFKHRPPAEKTSQHKPIIKAKPLERKSSSNIRSKSVIDDDNIKTMMEIQKEKDYQMGVKDSVSCTKIDDFTSVRSESNVQLTEKMSDMVNAETKEMSQEHLKCVLKGVADNANQTGNDLIDELGTKLLPPLQYVPQSQRPPDTVRTNDDLVDKLVEVIWNHSKEKCNKTDDENETVKASRKKKKERRKTVTVSGAKNAQLICIRDEDSLYETSYDNSFEKCGNNTPNKIPLPKPQLQMHSEGVVEIQNKDVNFHQINTRQPAVTTFDNAKQNQHQQSPTNVEHPPSRASSARTPRMKISRLPKVSLQPLKMLPKKFALNILEYKINYIKARKGNHMYKKSASKQPWLLMGEISDKILDELLQSVGAEIQIDHLIDGIIASEFV